MKTSTRNSRGLAIITTLMILSLLLALITAFLRVNQAGNRFTMNSLEKRLGEDVCQTAVSYAWYKLESTRGWGTPDIAPEGTTRYPLAGPQLEMTASQASEGDALNAPRLQISGKYAPNGNFTDPSGNFTMQVENNVENRKTVAGVDGPIPPYSARVKVEATIGGVKRQLVTVLRLKPQSHDTASAGGNIDLDDVTGLVRFESKDDYVNRVHAGEDLNLPFADNVKFLKHGVGASRERLNVGGVDLATSSPEIRREAGEDSGGTYLTNMQAPEIQEFDPTKLSLPNLTSNIAAGTWTFGNVTRRDYIDHTLQYTEVVMTPTGPETTTDSCVRYQERRSVYNQLTSPDGRVYVAGTEQAGSVALDPPYDPAGMYPSEGAANGYGYAAPGDEGFFTGEDGSGPEVTPAGVPSDVHEIRPGFKANVTTAQMVVLPGYKLVAGGNFIVQGLGDRLPELYFGYDLTPGGVARQMSLDDGVEAAQEDPAKYMAAILADGDVNVTGGVLGFGSMLAGGDLTIKASSGLRAAPDLGVVVKGRRIIIEPATEPEPGFPGEPVDADYPLYRNAIQANTGGNWAQYNAWLDHDQATRDTILASLGSQTTGQSATVMWNTLCSQIGKSFPAPDFSSLGWNTGNITVEEYMRMKEFLQTRASGYKGGLGDTTWLDLGVRDEDALGRVAGVLNQIAQWSRSYNQTFQQYLTTPNQEPPDMFLAGLIFADNDLVVNANGKSLRLEGSVIARSGDIRVNGASAVDLVYNRMLTDDLEKKLPPNNPIQLEKVFSTLE